MDFWRLQTTRAGRGSFSWRSESPRAHAGAGSAALIRSIDAAVAARVDNILGFTDIEHYSVYRGGDETHPVAEMTVRDTYKKGVGKEYTVLSQSGSGIVCASD